MRTWGEPTAPAVLYWDGIGGSGLHANEIAPILVEEYGLRVLAPDPPGHGRSVALPLEAYRPSTLATLAADVLGALGVQRVTFAGFSWGARVACAFGARYPERTSALALIEGGYIDFVDLPEASADVTLDECVEEARRASGDEEFPGWEAYYASERAALGRWTPALRKAHRAMMRERGGRIVPISEPELAGAIKYGSIREPVVATYPRLAAAGIPTLLLAATQPAEPGQAGVNRLQTAVPQARVHLVPGGVHDLVSSIPDRVATIIGEWLSGPAALDS